jgi:serine phosphatase RsbU (regulator of sigma subunit)/putative methionine-R-sulfoxide reductase with GAF domain
LRTKNQRPAGTAEGMAWDSNPSGLRAGLAAAYGLLVGLAGVGLLVVVLATSPRSSLWVAVLAFAALSVPVQRSSSHLTSGRSLSGLIDLAAVLSLGAGNGAAVAALSGFTYLTLSTLRRRGLSFRELVVLPVFDCGLKALMALFAGWLFGALLGGGIQTHGPLVASALVSPREVLIIAELCLAWFALDHLGWGILDAIEGGRKGLRSTYYKAFPDMLLVELAPLPFGAVLALLYASFQPGVLVLIWLAVFAAAVLVQRWSDGQRQLRQRVAELSTLEEVGRAIAQAQFDVTSLCRLLYERTSQIVDTTIFHLGLFEGDDYVIKLWMREDQPEPERTFHLSPGVGLVNWMRDSQQPLLVQDFDREMDSLPARPAYVADRPPRSALFVPLMAGESVIGTLSVQSYQRAAYGTNDLRVLSAVANQAALAIQKARLFEREQKRARQLHTIGQVVGRVSATLELNELFRETVGLVRESFGYYHVGLFTADRATQTVTFQASASAGEHNVAFEVNWGEGLIGWVAAHADRVMANDVEQDARYRPVDALEETRAEVAVPLCLENELVGVLDVQSDQPNVFGTDDLFILETLGAQVAIAIQEARLYEAEKEQAWLSSALLQVSDSLSELSDIGEVIATVVRLTPMLVGAERCGILLWDGDAEAFIPANTYGLSPGLRAQLAGMSFPAGSFPALDLIRSEKKPLVIDVSKNGELLPPSLADKYEIREMAAVPLIAQGELLGAMFADYAGRPHPFDERTMTMLGGLARQAAMAIQGARLLQAQEEDAYTAMALLQVSDAVSRSANLSESLAAVMRITPMLIGVDACALFLTDQGGESLLPYKQYGLSPQAQTAFWELRLSPLDPPARELGSGRAYALASDTPELANVEAAHGGGSLALLPVTARGELVGLMAVDCSGPFRHLTEHRLGILNGIAAQVSIAVESDRLRQEAAEQERMKQELAVAKRIQISFLPESCPAIPGWEFAAIWRSAREVAGDFYDFIPLQAAEGAEPGRTGIVIADVADKGVPAALFMALSRTLMRTMAITGRPPASAVAIANNLILADTRSELFVTLFYTILEPATGRISYVNAGHPLPLLVRATSGDVEELRTGGMAMGVLPDLEYVEGTSHVAPGDALILYTDGIPEASDGAGHMFGRKRLADVARMHRHEPANKLGDAIEAAVRQFVADAPQSDDLTLVVVKRQP